MIDRLATLLAPLDLDFEIVHSSNLSKGYQFENNALKTISINETSGLGLRIIQNGRLGFAATTDLNNLQRLIDQAVVSARFGKKAHFEFPRTCKTTTTPVYDPNLKNLLDTTPLSHCTEIIERLSSLSDNIKINTQASSGIAETTILNSSGLRLSSTDSGFGLFADILRVNADGMLMLSHRSSSARYENKVDDIVDEISRLFQQSQQIVAARTEKIPVIFTPRSVRMLLRMILLGINGKSVQKGISPLAEKLGEHIISPLISLIDDPSIPYAYGSAQFDMEGTSVTKKHLIKKGVLQTHLYDLETAGACNTVATGNATRGFSSQPGIDISNMVLESGNLSNEALYSQFPRALIVEQVLGEGQGNSLAGEFSVNVGLGFLVENGTITGRIKDGMLAGNIYEFGSALVGLSEERQQNGASLLPHLLVDNLSLSGKA